MIDPLTALSVASAAVGQMRTLINAGRDTTSALTKFAGAWADINEAERQAKNPPWYKTFSGSLEEQAAQAFACKKKAEALKADLENMIRFIHGPKGLEEYKEILRNMRKQKEKTEFRKAKLKQAIIEWIFGVIAVLVVGLILTTVIYFVGKGQGKW
jgi:tetrahydromethanopterin S-methyltransferase subunit G